MNFTEDPCIECHNFEKRNSYLAQLKNKFDVQSKNQYRKLYEIAPIGLFRARISDGKLIECNPSFVNLMGFNNKEECLSKCSFIKTYIKPTAKNEYFSLSDGNNEFKRFEAEIKSNGNWIWAEITFNPFVEFDYIDGSIVDITVSKVLSPTEKMVLEILLQGKSNKGIAFILKRSIRTIEDHRARIMRKLNVHNLVDLTKKTMFFQLEGGPIV